MTQPNELIFYVYGLYDPRNNQLFYIGKGCGNRVNKHMMESQDKHHNNTLKINKIKSLKNKNLTPIIKYFSENLTESQAHGLEIELIQKYGRLDLGTGILTNMTNGGDGFSGRVMSIEERKKISNRSYYKDPEYLEKQRKAQLKRYEKPGEKEKMSLAAKNRKPVRNSDEAEWCALIAGLNVFKLIKNKDTNFNILLKNNDILIARWEVRKGIYFDGGLSGKNIK